MKFLFFCTSSPFGEASGSGRRTHLVASSLKRIGNVTMVCATERPWTATQYTRAKDEFGLAKVFNYHRLTRRGVGEVLRRQFSSKYLNLNGTFVSNEDQAEVRRLVAEHDVIWIHTTKVANSLGLYCWPHSVLDIDDIPSLYHHSVFRHSKSLKIKAKRWYRSRLALRQERQALRRFSAVTVCKQEDVSHFDDPRRVFVLPNSVVLKAHEQFNGVRKPLPVLGMLGDFNHPPNVEGLTWFAREVVPWLLPRFPKLQLHVVGRGSDAVVSALGVPSVIGLGYVDDLVAETQSWAAMIVPTRIGGGTHVKVAEAMGRGIPIVTTAHGLRGYEMVPGEHALVGNSVEEFGEGCLRVLSDFSVGEQLAKRSFAVYERTLSPAAIQQVVEASVIAARNDKNVSRIE